MKRAFTLVEIMVVVGILAVLAALSISMMLRNRMTANETIAITSLKTIASACQSYYAGSLPHTYPPTLETLGSAGGTGPAYIDDSLASGTKSGYKYIYTMVNPISFTVRAEPEYPGRTGERYFYTDETGKITARTGGSAIPSDPAIN